MLFNSFCAEGDIGFDGKPSETSSTKTKSPATSRDAVPVFGNIIPSWIHVPVTQRGTDVENFSLKRVF